MLSPAFAMPRVYLLHHYVVVKSLYKSPWYAPIADGFGLNHTTMASFYQCPPIVFKIAQKPVP